jgi:hypothetical protein
VTNKARDTPQGKSRSSYTIDDFELDSSKGDIPLTTSNVRVGLIGTSWFAGMFHIPLTQSHEGVDLVSICGRDKTNADEIAAQHGIENVYTDYRTLVDSDDWGRLRAVSVPAGPTSELNGARKSAIW